MKILSQLTIAFSLIAGAGFATSAQAAQYYNCATLSSGCEPVKSVGEKNDHTATENPVVLAHGMAGWTKLFGLVDYFYTIPEDLMAGGSEVYATKTSSFQDSEYRGEQLLSQVRTITAVSGKDKVNLFGHSHGGIDIRYVAAVAPELVASVTAVSSPEQGSKIADLVYDLAIKSSEASGYTDGELNGLFKTVVKFVNAIGSFMDVSSGISPDKLNEQDSYAGLISLTTDYANNYFNVKYPEAMPTEYCGQPPENNVVNDVSYYSFSGIGTFYNVFDPLDYGISIIEPIFQGDPNDGLVSACSSRLGHVIRDDYPMNHLDSVNHILGMVAWGQVKPAAIYRNQVNRLKLEGK